MPSPQAEKIILSQRQQTLLQKIVRRTTNPYRLVRRSQLILSAAAGASNSQLTRELELERSQVRLWRERWLAATPQLATVEAKNSSDRELIALITRVLSDRARPGTTNYFSTEQVVQIVAVACESPQTSGYPVSHWTPRELAAEAIKRGIVQRISPRSVGRFLKGSYFTASSSPLLAQCQS
ncbi:MAG: helix-turn-helix domain-containing protein [Coleofasciculus sp. Co-bin14]|nr:helix-turn-helix domain-containing protein [Coleofasciculus sp. Co-bin14]